MFLNVGQGYLVDFVAIKQFQIANAALFITKGYQFSIVKTPRRGLLSIWLDDLLRGLHLLRGLGWRCRLLGRWHCLHGRLGFWHGGEKKGKRPCRTFEAK